jgi:DNA primase
VSAATLLDRLDRVKATGPNRWLARCPSHEDHAPSLSIRELDDGRVLVHDFGGCEIGDVLAAVGLGLSDLFPQRLPQHVYAAAHSHIPARDLLDIVSEETSVIAIVAADIITKKTVSDLDWRRLAQAAARLFRARDHAYGR